MYGQYIADGTIDAPLLFLGEVTPSDAAALIAVLKPLAGGSRESVALHNVRGWPSDSTLRLEAVTAARDEGCAPVGSPQTHFRCAFRAVTWDQIISFLAPFAVEGSSDGHHHQYLSHHGLVTWIVSTDSTW